MTHRISTTWGTIIVALVVCLLLTTATWSRTPVDSSRVANSAAAAALAPYCITQHTVGNVLFTVSNYGKIGTESRPPLADCFTGELLRNAEYPPRSGTIHLYEAGLWIGAVVGEDTLVSTATDQRTTSREFNPAPSPEGDITRRSNLDENEAERELAVSEQDFITTYTDTMVFGVPDISFDPILSRFHEPIGIEVTQRSYVWSYAYADDLILFDFTIKNLSENTLRDVYIGFFMDCDVAIYSPNLAPVVMGAYAKGSLGGGDDLSGIIRTWPIGPDQCAFEDTLNLIWAADNDGDYDSDGNFRVPNVFGFRSLELPDPGQKLTYNWWVYNDNPVLDFGPQLIDNFRDLDGRVGSPFGDRNKYFLLSNGEIDHDQIRTLGFRSYEHVWQYLTNRGLAFQLSQGSDNRQLYSIGPYTMQPGEAFNYPVAFVGGENWHTYTRNVLWNIRNAYRPDEYYRRVNISDFVQNARWAAWIYDNPGVDTDNDGNAGKYTICVLDSAFVNGEWITNVAETTYYAGDGRPDWEAASPPPPPKLWVEPALRGIKVRWNGLRSETTRDVFSGLVDFEGYRVYFSRDDRENSYTLVSSYDQENYDKYALMRDPDGVQEFRLTGLPMTDEEIRCRYAPGPDPCDNEEFEPLLFTHSNPFVWDLFPNDSVFYFVPHDYNTYEFGRTTGIIKRFPDEPLPGPNPPPEAYTEDGYLKYYEYEYTIEDLLPSVPYYVSVTAFDFGSPQTGLQPLESSKTLNPGYTYPAAAPDQLSEERPDVYVYPNPYIADGGYRRHGYEGRGSVFTNPDRVRAVHFANVPPHATIRIFSLDGDLIRQLEHDKPLSDPTNNHAEWDLITRNTQMIVSGIYYWTVEDKATGEIQIGKLIVIF